MAAISRLRSEEYTSGMNVALLELASFIAELTFDRLPEAVIDRAKWILRDTLGVIIGAMVEPEVRHLADYAASQGAGAATIIAHGTRVSPQQASLVHGVAGTTLELDEGHARARGHGAVHAVPTALALAEAGRASGSTFLTWLVAGYEVAVRAGMATQLRPAVHPFGTWGIVGTAGLAACALGLEPAGITGTIELASSYAFSSANQAAYQGASVRNTYVGMVNQLGIFAADLYRMGFRGLPGGLAVTFGEILGTAFDPAVLAEGLGQHYALLGGYFKPYSACRHCHAAVDALIALAMAPASSAVLESIQTIEVATYDAAAALCDPEPQTPLAARFSIPYVVSAGLLLGSVDREAFVPQRLQDPRHRALAARVQVLEDPQFTAMTPAQRPARVTIRLIDGTQRQATVTGSKGDPDKPMTPAELETKFQRLVAPVLGADRVEAIWQAAGLIDEMPHLDRLMALLSPEGHSPA